MCFKKSLCSIVAIALPTVLVASLAAANDPMAGEGSQAERWVPAFSFEASFLAEDLRAEVESDQRPDTPTDGSSRIVIPSLGVRLQLATPSLADLSDLTGSPATVRLFVHTGVAYSIDKATSLAREGTVGRFVAPDARGAPQGIDADEFIEVYSGLGSEVSSKVQPLLFSAGLGADFAFTLFDRMLHVKPSFEYRREEIEFSAYAGGLLANPANANSGRCPCFGFRLRADEHQVYHGVGPGLELELEAVRGEEFLVSVYTQAVGYANLGQRTQRWTKTGLYEDGITPGNVTGTVKVPDWTIRAGLGIRVSWLPSSM